MTVGTNSQPFVIQRGPLDDDELWEFVYTIFDIQIPRLRVCKNHCAPFEAFADAFFARSPVSVWKASRGFGGKTTLLGALVITESLALGAWTTVLGGSSAQSLRVQEVLQVECLTSPRFPKTMLAKDPTRFDTHLTNGGWVRALMASQRSVRGPHPQRLRLDEIDEMDLDILEAAQGQPMSRQGIETQTVMSSTHQYPDKTMTAILKRAGEKGWPVFEWCYKESMEPHGWLPLSDIQRKRQEVTKAMWDIEYDLQEPSFEGRAIDPAAVEAMFDPALGMFEGKPGEYIELEPPQPAYRYINAADWAKQKDWTVITTWRQLEDGKWRLVAFERVNRRPWPDMVSRLETRMDRYRGFHGHDATGIGNVVADLVTKEIEDFVLVGRVRDSLWSEYVSAIENHQFEAPMIRFMYEEHKYASIEDLWGKGHTPDSFVSGAVAWGMRRHVLRPRIAPIISFTREASPWKIE